MPQSLPDAALRLSGGTSAEGRPVPRGARRSRRETAALLARVPLLARLSKRHLLELAADADQVALEPGQTVVEEGMLGEAMFVVLTGSAVVTRRRRRVGQILPGDFFGELSVIDGGPRSATVRAETGLTLLRLSRATVRRLIEEDPAIAITILEVMVGRLRQISRATA
ncbi:MAG TPA: cyclic nucleotide-binding domain-containing protein [Actinomycetota bacterium]|nr:cyclic nucleotide-binding domain-containing protein [Actinomycetota bacterium]